jgi:uncharacterized caspase-like protein
VSFGVNHFQNSSWDLSYAAEDAAGIVKALKGALEGLVLVFTTRLSTLPGDRAPDKAALRDTLSALSGFPSGTSSVPAAGPDDLVIVTFSTHGITDSEGVFYILPSDMPGQGRELTAFSWDKAVSADELAEWLGPLRAGELLLVLDTCQSAAVGGDGFRPGPMGDRGFGQFVYDRAARVICAVDEDSLALETPALRHGVLSYALIEYLERVRSGTTKVFNASIWLRYTRDRAKEIYGLLKRGQSPTDSRGVPISAAGVKPSGDDRPGQSPLLYDFGRNCGGDKRE